jgi:hypothetical protein
LSFGRESAVAAAQGIRAFAMRYDTLAMRLVIRVALLIRYALSYWIPETAGICGARRANA